MRTYLLAILALWAGTVSGAFASMVTVVVDVEADVLDQEFSVGDVITLPLTIEHESTAGVCAVDLELTCASDAVHILSVTINDAFPLVLAEDPEELPALHYHTVRAQRMTALDRTLGAKGAAVSLGTVELEVLTDAPFDSALTVRAEAATIGRNRPRTVIQPPGVEAARASTVGIAIRHPDLSAEQEPDEEDPWTCEEASLALEVQPLGGGEPVTVLAPDTTYELHYQAGYERVDFYILFAIGMSADQGFTDAVPPETGDWASSGDFQFVDIEAELDELIPAPGYPEGYYRTYMVVDDFWPDTDRYAGPAGHLCDLTTGSAGVLNLEFYMAYTDRDQYHHVAMHTQTEFLVQESTVDDGDDE